MSLSRVIPVCTCFVYCLILSACGDLGQGTAGVPTPPGTNARHVGEDAVQGKADCSVNPDPVFSGDNFMIIAQGMQRITTVRFAINDASGSRVIETQSDYDGRCSITQTAGNVGAGQVSVSALRKQGFRDLASCTYSVVTPPACGDGTCDATEDCGSCDIDCGACPTCGDRTCDVGEDCSSCASDCGACATTCGDGVCEGVEDCGSCASDCGACPPTCGDGQPGSYDPEVFDNVLENFEQTSRLTLSGSSWDNTLVRNCLIHDTGSDGIFIKNVRNVVITGCEIWNTDGVGIKTSSTGSTEDVTLDGNYIHDTGTQAIHSPQRVMEGIDHKNLKILNNIVEDVGSHSIYVQSQDFLIEGNTIRGQRKSNGISVRSSGIVRCNHVEGTSTSGKPGIRYYSDHQTGLSETLVIENNSVVNDGVGIDLYAHTVRYDGQPPPDHVVKNFVIRHNTIDAPTPIRVSDDYDDSMFTVEFYDNN